MKSSYAVTRARGAETAPLPAQRSAFEPGTYRLTHFHISNPTPLRFRQHQQHRDHQHAGKRAEHRNRWPQRHHLRCEPHHGWEERTDRASAIIAESLAGTTYFGRV